MDVEKIRKLRLGEPFKPFSLLTKNGVHLPVEFPRWLSIAPNGKRLAYSPPTGGVEFIPVDDITDAVVDEKLSTFWRRSK
jgi:hypothetical protein